jgi:DNA-binding NtrC family response regulator
MPRLDGIELLTWIKQTHPEISVIAVSGFADTLLAGKLIRPEMDEYCQKPFTPQEMMLLLERVQEKRRNHEFDHE